MTTTPDPSNAESQGADDSDRFARVWAIGLGVLVLVTYPLWFQLPSSASDFPRVTWFTIPGGSMFASSIDWAALVGLIVSLVTVVYSPQRRWCWWFIGAALATLILTDQQRLQPWAYQSILYAMILGGLSWREGRRWMTAIAISIYFYSAAGKLDYQFVHTVGRQMIQVFAQPIGGVSDAVATKLAFVLPLGELSIAALIAIPITRRIGGIGAIAMHIMLIALLGPLALGHSWGVLVWNALLGAQGWLLFVKKTTQVDAAAKAAASPTPVPTRWALRMTVLVALLAPLAERFGWWDHWTSWALYSPHNSRVEIQIHNSAADQLPISSQRFLREDADSDRWQDLDIEAWSLATRLAPIYPQARYQLDFASKLANESDLNTAIRVKVKNVSDRWTGQRQEVFLIGQQELERELNRYWLTSQP